MNEQFADAVNVYTQALAVAPKNATLLLRRAIAQQACGAIDAARADFTSVLANRPTPYIRQRAVVLLAALTPTTTHMDSESEPFSSADRVGEEVLG